MHTLYCTRGSPQLSHLNVDNVTRQSSSEGTPISCHSHIYFFLVLNVPACFLDGTSSFPKVMMISISVGAPDSFSLSMFTPGDRIFMRGDTVEQVKLIENLIKCGRTCLSCLETAC